MVTLGSAGDMYPFLRMARELLARGHRVTLLGPAAHAPMADAAGVPFHGIGKVADYAEVLAHPDLWHPRRGFEVLWREVSSRLDTPDDFIAGLPPGERCAMLAHPLAMPFADLLRAERPGLRVVAAWLAPANLRSVHDPLTIGPLRIPRWLPLAWRHALWRWVDSALIDAVALPALDAARQRRGLPPVAHFVDYLQSAADAHVTLFPPWFAPTPPDWPRPLAEGVFALYDPSPATSGRPFSSGLERFLQSGPAPVVFTPGSANRQAAAWFDRALAAVTRLGRRAIFLTPHRAQVPATLPHTVLWLPYVPLRTLLTRAAVLVHHGGIGTTAEALRAGVPQLVLPLAYDQFDNAARVEALGAGATLPAHRATPRRLARALARLSGSPAIAAACTRAAARVAADAPTRLADIVEPLLGLVAPPSRH